MLTFFSSFLNNEFKIEINKNLFVNHLTKDKTNRKKKKKRVITF